MADNTTDLHQGEKVAVKQDTMATGVDTPPEVINYNEPARWYNTGLKVFGKRLLPYNHAIVQLLMVSFVCFMCPGMYNALTGLGGAGLPREYVHVADNSSVALYCTFAAVGFMSGAITNVIGAKWSIAVGGIGYCIYVSSYICFNHTGNTGYIIASGAILGICAGMLWSGQGVVIMSYPTESQKGKFVGIFWIIFNLGAVIGSIVPLAQTANNSDLEAVGDGTYAAFLALMFVGAIIAMLMMPERKVVKSDGTHVMVKDSPTIWSEIKGLFWVLKVDYHIILLFPMFWSSNWFYTYQFADFNSAMFNARTRSLNNLLYWFSQMIGAYLWGSALDWTRFSRRMRARVFHGILFVLTMVIWGGGYAYQKTYTREMTSSPDFVSVDWTAGGKNYVGPLFLYIFYGIYDAVWQTYVYWLMGSLSNSARRLALYAGFYKGIQSAAAAVTWRLDAQHHSYMAMFASSWGLLAGSLLIATPIVYLKVQEHADLEADAQFTDGVHADEMATKLATGKTIKDIEHQEEKGPEV